MSLLHLSRHEPGSRLRVRASFALLAGFLSLLTLPLIGADSAEARPRVIILGFDGVDPDMVEDYIAQGHLPNLEQLSQRGTFGPLATTNPAESPVSWASFATAQNPGHHGIFDFLRRVPGTYYPEIALAEEVSEPVPGLPQGAASRGVMTAAIGLGVFLIAFLILRALKAPGAIATLVALVLAIPAWGVGAVALYRWIPEEVPTAKASRAGTSFWEFAAAEGLRATVIDAPVTFPAKQVDNVQLTTGLGTPDIRKTWGNWSLYSSASFDRKVSETGGNLIHVLMNGDRGEVPLRGPANFLVDGKPELTSPIVFERLGQGRMRVTLQGQSFELTEGEWSDWAVLTFKMNPLIKVVGMTRFKLIEAGDDFRIYQEPLNFHPHHLPPTVNISSPRDYAGDLADRYGIRETLGWSIATNPLKDDAIDYGTFVEDVNFTLAQRERVVKGELAREDWDLFIGVFLSTDRMQHMMFRFIDPKHPYYDAELAAEYGGEILRVYREMDRIVGDVMRDYGDEETLIMVVSDHGFHSFRRGVNLNTWLVKEGFMTLKGMGPAANYQKLEDLFDPEGRFFKNVDWNRTKAYCLGLGTIFINLRGRESQGSVDSVDYDDIRDQIRSGLKALVDPEHPGDPVVLDVYRREDIFKGPRMPLAPDLVVGFHEGYRVSWQTAAGGIPPDVFEDNMNNWSGDHCSVSPFVTHGIFFANRSLPDRERSIMDVGPTALEHLGVAIPAQMEGTPLTSSPPAESR